MNERAWFWIGGYLLIGVVVLIWSSRHPDRHPFLRTIPAMLGDPIVSGCLFPITGILGIALWPVLLLVDLCVPSVRLDAHSSAPQDGGDTPAVGSVGISVTALKPSGKIEIERKRFDATCVKDFVPEGRRVRVVRRQGFNLVVEEIV